MLSNPRFAAFSTDFPAVLPQEAHASKFPLVDLAPVSFLLSADSPRTFLRWRIEAYALAATIACPATGWQRRPKIMLGRPLAHGHTC